MWYVELMDGYYNVRMGNRGRIVVPAEARQRAGLAEGTSLALLETPGGLVLMTQEQLRERVRRELRGVDLVSGLLADRRLAARREGCRVSPVLDASAILVFLQDEEGAGVVEEALVGEPRCGAANWSE